MATGFEALVPVFLVILIGWTLRATGTVSDDMWKVLEHVCYYVLFPALMFHKIAGADLAGAPVFAMGAAMLLAIATMLALLLALRIKIMTALTITGASYSSIFQGATRWNTFVALSVIAVILGDDGLTLAAIGMAAMIPALNIANVIVISLNAEGTRPTTRRIVNLVIRNPLVLACLAGIAVNGLGIGLAGVFARTLDLIGTGALGVGLLTVGAALRLGGFAAHGAVEYAAPAAHACPDVCLDVDPRR